MKWFVSYTVQTGPDRFEQLLSGPYTEDEVLLMKMTIQNFENVSAVFITTSNATQKKGA